MSNEFGKELVKEVVTQTAGKTYDDVAHPAAKATGQLISFIPRTIQVWLGKWEKWIINGEYSIEETKKLLEKKLANVAEDKITEPESYVAVPAIQQLSYSLDSEDLREMYANLLASSMNIETKTSVHPAFVDIIKQLCPDEAKLLKYLSDKEDQPLIDIHLIQSKNREYSISLQNFTSIADGICENSLKISFYLDNLARLKLLDISDDRSLADDSEYKPLENHPLVKQIMNVQLPEGKSYEIKRHSFKLTAFAFDFIKVCL
jgi:hypothetical protein